MKNISVCPICEEGSLEAKIGSNEVEYKSQKTALPLHFSECESCGSEQASPIELRINKRLMIDFKKKVDGLLTGKEVKEIRLSLGLTQADAANIFGGGPVAFAKYEADDVAQSGAMDKLLRLAHAVPEATAYLTYSSACKTINTQVHESFKLTWVTLEDVNIGQKRDQKRTPNLTVISRNDIYNGEAYGQLIAVGQ
jgi:HTH-type transcriptional regulator/antitoxin MqsA